MSKILVPTDFSQCADNALEYAIYLAQKMKTARLRDLYQFIDRYMKTNSTSQALRQAA